MKMYAFAVLAVIGCFHACAGQEPCASLDAGPYLQTKPTLFMRVYEATQEDLERYPNSEKYQDSLRLAGIINDGGASGISLEVMEDFRLIDPRDVFVFETEVVSGKNVLRLVNAVDRDGSTEALDDDINLFTFTLRCVPVSNTSIEVYYDVRVQVMDENDNYPSFVGTPYNVMVSEASPIGSVIGHVKAVDIDFILNSNITYSIVPANVDDGSAIFDVDTLSGEIIVSDVLDYDSLSQGHEYNLEVMATDSDMDSPKSAKVIVNVKVTDADDQGPVFEYEGCFRHMGTCAWPKYTTMSNQMKIGEPLVVYPVPNKISQPVSIKARDLDASMSEVKFSIASTIPPGFESHFSVSTNHANGAYYTATVKQTTPLAVSEGFEIFLKVEELTGEQRHEIAMIYFLGQNNGGSATTQSPSGPDSEGQEGSPDKTPVTSTGYSQDTLALIVVVAILAAIVFCLVIAFLCFVTKRTNKGDKYKTSQGITNGAYN